jgi:hypothetical protein
MCPLENMIMLKTIEQSATAATANQTASSL